MASVRPSPSSGTPTGELAISHCNVIMRRRAPVPGGCSSVAVFWGEDGVAVREDPNGDNRYGRTRQVDCKRKLIINQELGKRKRNGYADVTSFIRKRAATLRSKRLAKEKPVDVHGSTKKALAAEFEPVAQARLVMSNLYAQPENVYENNEHDTHLLKGTCSEKLQTSAGCSANAVQPLQLDIDQPAVGKLETVSLIPLSSHSAEVVDALNCTEIVDRPDKMATLPNAFIEEPSNIRNERRLISRGTIFGYY